jgi:hypothetical protein
VRHRAADALTEATKLAQPRDEKTQTVFEGHRVVVEPPYSEIVVGPRCAHIAGRRLGDRDQRWAELGGQRFRMDPVVQILAVQYSGR